MVKRTGICVFV